MANYCFNISKGRGVEFYNRARSNDPAAAELVLVPLAASGTKAEAEDYDTLTAVLGGTANEAGASWGRKFLHDSSTPALPAFPAPDDTDNRYELTLPSVTWTTPTVGQNLSGLLVCYSAVHPVVDSTCIPISHHDLVFVADGLNFVLNASTFLHAT